MSFSMRFPGHETISIGNRVRVNNASLSTLKDFVGEAIYLRLKPLYGLRRLEIVFIFPRLVLQILFQLQFGLSYQCEIYHRHK